MTVDNPTGTSFTVEELSTMSFEAMTGLDDPMPKAVFFDRMSSVFTLVSITAKLLAMTPQDMASALFRASPDDPASIVEDMDDQIEWLQGLAAVIACARARTLVSLSHEAVRQ